MMKSAAEHALLLANLLLIHVVSGAASGSR